MAIFGFLEAQPAITSRDMASGTLYLIIFFIVKTSLILSLFGLGSRLRWAKLELIAAGSAGPGC
jgi:hypothetical protein